VFGMGTGVTLAVLPPETFCSPRRSGLVRSARSERDNRFGWHYRFDSKSNALCIIWLLLFPKDGLGKFYD
jgi:hypothetical protein